MVRVLGHRGLRQHAEIDENSLAAFEAGFNGADGIETDTAVTADKTVFLAHEFTQQYIRHLFSRSIYVFSRNLDKESADTVGAKRLEQLPDSVVEKLRLQKGAKVPRLSETFNLLAQHPGKIIDIELKGQETVEPTLEEINKAVAAGKIKKEQIILTSFNHFAIQKAKQLEPAIKCGLIFSGNEHFDSRIFPWSDNKASRYAEFNEKALKSKLVNEINPDFFIVKHTVVTAKNVALLHRYFPDAKLMFWTSAEKPPQENKQILKLLADPQIGPAIEAVITDYPQQMAKLLKAKGFKP